MIANYRSPAARITPEGDYQYYVLLLAVEQGTYDRPILNDIWLFFSAVPVTTILGSAHS